ncbi:MAG: DUF742 domain-containing protein [Streptosporangiaceae bacterium]
MGSGTSKWLDHDAGPVVRPYALVGGRTRAGDETFELICMITAVRRPRDGVQDLEPEHLALLHRCRIPTSVADLAAAEDLPVGVVQILLADLRERGLIAVHHPAVSRLADPQLLKEVADGLRKL